MYRFLFSLPGFMVLKAVVSRLIVRWRIRPTDEEARAYNTSSKILLSFDDMGDEQDISRLLGILATYRVKAAFFLRGDWANENSALVDMIRRDGHWVGGHSVSHPLLTHLSDEELERQIVAGVEGRLFRPPYGGYDERVRRIARSRGFRIAFWTIDSDDWRGLTAPQIQRKVWQDLHAGACVLLHINAPHTAEALPGLIEGIRARGYELCSGGEIEV